MGDNPECSLENHYYAMRLFQNPTGLLRLHVCDLSTIKTMPSAKLFFVSTQLSWSIIPYTK